MNRNMKLSHLLVTLPASGIPIWGILRFMLSAFYGILTNMEASQYCCLIFKIQLYLKMMLVIAWPAHVTGHLPEGGSTATQMVGAAAFGGVAVGGGAFA